MDEKTPRMRNGRGKPNGPRRSARINRSLLQVEAELPSDKDSNRASPTSITLTSITSFDSPVASTTTITSEEESVERPMDIEEIVDSPDTRNSDESMPTGLYFGKTETDLEDFFAPLVENKKKSISSALKARMVEFISNAPTKVIIAALRGEKARLYLQRKSLAQTEPSDLESFLHWLLSYPEEVVTSSKQKNGDSKRRITNKFTQHKYVVTLLVLMTKLVSQIPQDTCKEAGIKELTTYLLEAVLEYARAAKSYTDAFNQTDHDSRSSFLQALSPALHARAEEAMDELSCSHDAFELKAKLKKIVLKALFGDVSFDLESFVDESDKNAALLTRMCAKLKSPLVKKAIEKVCRVRNLKWPPLLLQTVEELRAYWIGAGPSQPFNNSKYAASVTPSCTPPKNQRGTDSGILPVPLDQLLVLLGSVDITKVRTVAEELEKEYPGFGLFDAFIGRFRAAFPEVSFPTPVVAPGKADDKTTLAHLTPSSTTGTAIAPSVEIPASSSTVGSSIATVLDSGPVFTLNGFIQNDTVRLCLEEAKHDIGGDSLLVDLPELLDAYKKNPTAPVSIREEAAAGVLWNMESDHFVITEQLGEGGVGYVYGIETDKSYAALKLQVVAMENILKVFVRPMLHHALVDHGNVAQPLGWFVQRVGKEDDNLCLVGIIMEKCSGRTLDDEIEDIVSLTKDKKLTLTSKLRRIAKNTIQYMSAASACEEKGFMHRDLKPENFLFDTQTGKLKVGDFGLARSADEEKETTMQVGTVSYRAPEGLTSPTVSNKLDVYCCGVILYELITGELPKRVGSNKPTGDAHLVADVFHHPLFKELSKSIDDGGITQGAELGALCKEMLAYDYGDRPSMKIALAKMKEIVANLPSDNAASK